MNTCRLQKRNKQKINLKVNINKIVYKLIAKLHTYWTYTFGLNY